MVPRDVNHFIVHKNPHGYSSWPDITRLSNGDFIVGFSQSMRYDYLVHRAPTFHNLMVRSGDQGETWESHPQAVPGYSFFGIDCIGVTQLSNGELLARTTRDDFVPSNAAERNPEYAHYKRQGGFDGYGNRSPEPFPWSWAHEGIYVMRSTDNGYSWEEPTKVNLAPFSTGFSPRPIVELDNGDLLLPAGDESLKPIPNYVVKSRDGGKTWGDVTVIAKDDAISFYEPCLLVLSDDRIIAMLRTHEPGGYHLHQCESYDGGDTWTSPRKTPMWGYPAHMLLLDDGRILCAYGHRRKPYGVRACLSADEGKSWDIDNELILRDDFPNRDLGYPTSVQMEDGRICTIYYGQDADGVTCIHGSVYRV